MTAADARPVKQLGFRADIDGLRGIAVASVVLYHVSSALLPGGFLGVDVFFVVSGYLISLQILSELEAGQFSLREFYRRRIKRIAPAMLVVVGVTLLATQLLLVPDDAEVAAEAALFSLLSLANVYFWAFFDTSYFAASTDEQPFLHLWSLGVEEQFYLIWPVLLLVIHRRTTRRGLAIGCSIAAVASFALGDLIFPRDASFAFYMLPTRAGELLLGALAALLVLSGRTGHGLERFAAPCAVAGLTMVAVSLFVVQENQPLPGWRALPVTVGTAMLIVAGQWRDSLPTRLLSWTPLVFLGAISYSAYLWHWPILAIPRYFGVEFGAGLGAAAILATVVAAWLSYRFVEQPARRTRHGFAKVATVGYVIPAGALVVFCIGAKVSDGYFPRSMFPELTARMRAAELETQPAFQSSYICQHALVRAAHLEDGRCVVGAASAGEPQIILWGDSNAAHYVGMLAAFARSAGYSFRNISTSGCPPILHDIDKVVNSNKLRECQDSASAIEPYLRKHAQIWIAADWLTYAKKSEHFLRALESTLRSLATDQHAIVLIGKAPVIDGYDRRCRQKAVVLPAMSCDYAAVPLRPDVMTINRALAEIATRVPPTRYFDANEQLCPSGTCPLVDSDGKLRYYDGTHLSLDASWRLGARILQSGVPDVFRTGS